MIHASALTALETMGFGTIPSPFARIKAALKAAHARRTARREYTYLLGAEDHLLQDIGISRADVRQALRECDGH
jgi:uncharacterized protein YjiS (DUF1127 family)